MYYRNQRNYIRELHKLVTINPTPPPPCPIADICLIDDLDTETVGQKTSVKIQSHDNVDNSDKWLQIKDSIYCQREGIMQSG